MENNSEALPAFAAELAWRQAIFLGPFVVLFLLAHVVLPESALLAILLVLSGVLAALVDLWCFDLVPTAFATPELEKASRVTACKIGLMISFLAGTSLFTRHDAVTVFFLVLGVKLLVPVVFGLCAYRAYRDDVFPLVVRLGAGTPALSQAMGEQAAAHAVEQRRQQHRVACVRDARRRVLAFYNRHRKQLQGRFDANWMEVEVPARIPEDATEQQAYRAASELLAAMTGVLRDRQQQLDAVDDQLKALEAARRAFRGNTTLEPDLVRDELADLDKRQRDLEARRATLARAA